MIIECKLGDRGIIKEIFVYKNRICVVVQMSFRENLSRTFLEGTTYLSDYCNGYVQSSKKNYGKDYDKFISRIETDELTYSDVLPPFKDIWFFGFDSAHYWNEQRPESKTFEEVRKRTIQLCEEMVKKRI